MMCYLKSPFSSEKVFMNLLKLIIPLDLLRADGLSATDSKSTVAVPEVIVAAANGT